MRFVVTGTGRSGTGYAAHLFTAAGLTCGHEEVFRVRPAALFPGARPHPTLFDRGGLKSRVWATVHWRLINPRRTGLDGDASWMAAPHLDRFEGVSFLQTRHPLPVIRSFIGTRFFSEHQGALQHRYATKFFSPTGNDILDAMRWWVFWNDLAAKHATFVYRLEDLDEHMLTEMLERVGVADAVSRAAQAFVAVPRDVNSSARLGYVPGSLGWDELPSGEAKDRLEEAMGRYGYATSQ